MGIQGLLPIFKSISQSTHVSEYAGKKVAVDTYGWLHKGALSCSKDLCLGRPTDKYVEYCMHRVRLLQHSKVIPVLVFDGGPLPGKLEEEERRQISRKENLDKALAHERSGNTSAAYECYQKAVDITPAHALRLIKVLQAQKIEYIVAPYEADAQLAYLALNGLVDAVITEDSDLLAHGCPKVLYKMDKFGNGVQILYSDLVKTKELCFTNFTQQMVLEMCIFSGCDYLPSLPGMGVKRAHALMKRFKNFRKAIKWLKFQGTDVPSDYEEAFQRAVLTFKHQRVFDPVSQRAVYLTEPYGGDIPVDLDFVGKPLSPAVAKAVATGQICPVTHAPFEDPQPVEKGTSTGKRKRKSEVMPERNTIHKYLTVKTSTSAKKPFKMPRTTGAAAPPPPVDRPHEIGLEEPSLPAPADDFDEWNRIPSASLPESDELEGDLRFQIRQEGAGFGRRHLANDFDFELEERGDPSPADLELELDNPFEAFRQRARRSPTIRGPADLFGAFEDTTNWANLSPPDPCTDSPAPQTRTRNFDRAEAPFQKREENELANRQTDNGFHLRRPENRVKHALQPVRLPDLNVGGALGAKPPPRKTSTFFKKPAAAEPGGNPPTRVPGLWAGLERRGGEAGRVESEGIQAREESREQEHRVEEQNDHDQFENRGAGQPYRYRQQQEQAGPEDDEDREDPNVFNKLGHLKGYNSTAKKAMEGLVSKLRSFKYIPSSSRQSALRNPLGKRSRNGFPR